MSRKSYRYVAVFPDTHRLVKTQASLEGMEMSEWLAKLIEREAEKKGKDPWRKYDDMRFF